MTVLLSTAYLPPVSYMALCLQSEKIVIERYETYPKQTFRNRCRIYGPNGMQTLSVPVVKVNGNHTLTKDIRIAKTAPWQRLHWRSIGTAYNNSPFFLYYKDDLEKVFVTQFDFLLDWNCTLMEILCRMLRIELKTGFTDQFDNAPEGMKDFRESSKKKNFIPSKHLPYTQVFSPKHGFLPDLSIIDLIFNMGPESAGFLV